MKDLKTKIVKSITKSGLTDKEVLAILDEVRKLYHDRKNVGDKVFTTKELHTTLYAVTTSGKLRSMSLSKDKLYVYYEGAWRKVYTDGYGKYFRYLKSPIAIKIKKNATGK